MIRIFLWATMVLALASIAQPSWADEPEFTSLSEALTTVKRTGYSETPTQIPATVVDTGILAFVPYISFSIGPDRELNIYGDPEHPACIEIGLYRYFLNSKEERRRSLDLLGKLVRGVDLQHVTLEGGKTLTSGVVAEVTLPGAPDAYGGWWISIYSLPRLHAAKGRPDEIEAITVQTDSSPGGVREWSADELNRSQRIHKSSSSFDRVYVKGYTRKDGTYVAPYTRSRPGH
jgi:hypothetical protein